MLKRLTFAGLAAVGLLFLFVFAQSDMSDEERATAYFEEIQAAPYTDWAFEPGVPEGFYTGSEPHSPILRTFINNIVAEAVGSGAAAFPEGSIIVKENHLPGDVDTASLERKAPVEGFEGDLDALTYMVKLPGYNPEAGDWFWVKQQPDGSIDAAGQPAGCIGCHTRVADNDYVYDTSLK